MKEEIVLSNGERTTLIMLHKVLLELGSDKKFHSNAVEILENGYYTMFGYESIGVNLSVPLSYERMNYVDDILDMYRWIQDSYKKLSEDDKEKIDAKKIVFGGFDGNNETDLLVYARFNMEKMERWSDLEIENGLNTHIQTNRKYKAMLEAMPEREGRILTVDEINKILNPF